MNASVRAELTVIDTRVLARGAAKAVRRGGCIPPPLPGAVCDLSWVVRALAVLSKSPPDEARGCALQAAARPRCSKRGTTWG